MALYWTARLQQHGRFGRRIAIQIGTVDAPEIHFGFVQGSSELSIDNYVSQTKLTTVSRNDKLSKKAIKVADALEAEGKIDKYQSVIGKLEKAEG